MNEQRQIAQGRLTYAGLAIAAAAFLARLFGLHVPEQEASDLAAAIAAHWPALAELAGLGIALYGRIRREHRPDPMPLSGRPWPLGEPLTADFSAEPRARRRIDPTLLPHLDPLRDHDDILRELHERDLPAPSFPSFGPPAEEPRSFPGADPGPQGGKPAVITSAAPAGGPAGAIPQASAAGTPLAHPLTSPEMEALTAAVLSHVLAALPKVMKKPAKRPGRKSAAAATLLLCAALTSCASLPGDPDYSLEGCVTVGPARVCVSPAK